MAKNVCCRLELAQHHQDWTIHDEYRMIFSDEIKINRIQSDGNDWCRGIDVETQFQTRHVN